MLANDLSASPLARWARSGGMALTGRAVGPPLASPGDPAGLVESLLVDLAATSELRGGRRPDACGSELIGERAALAGLVRNAPSSCGGAFRFLATVDGYLGLSIARDEDAALVPALVESAVLDPLPGPVTAAAWEALRAWASQARTDDTVARARLLGLPCAAVPRRGEPATPGPAQEPPPVVRRGGRRVVVASPLVVDFTALWAGPLCAQLLGSTGARVVKVESRSRPDGGRRGNQGFFDLLHGGHQTIAVDPDSAEDRARLLELVLRSDLVLEASRPRALRRWGLIAEDVVDHGVSWLSVTARGRESDTVGFGDDIAADAGLLAWEGDAPRLCGDALADPLAGVAAAAAASRALGEERATLTDVSMYAEARAAATLPGPEDHDVVAGPEGWCVVPSAGASYGVRLPRARKPARAARHLGADTLELLR